MPSRRMERVNASLRRELGELIRGELKDPRLSRFTSITHVDCSADLGVARVYVSVLGEETERASSIEALQSAAGLLRHRLKERMLLRRMPRLEFMPDHSMEDAADMLALIDRVSAEDAKSRHFAEDEEQEDR